MNNKPCPLCKNNQTELVRSLENYELNSENFKITDAHYGKTGPLYKCSSCHFLFVVFKEDIVKFYSELRDPEYEEGRDYRMEQQRELLKTLNRYAPQCKTLLDIGAGTGMLVEVANRMGYKAVGIEPSIWAAEHAQSRGLDVRCGTIRSQNIPKESFDLVTLVDVIEHVSEPMELLQESLAALSPKGYLLLNTPNVGSLMARILGFRWWHYRIAHVGYFNKKNITSALDQSGCAIVHISSPGWYFTIGYLYDRVRCYLPWLPQINYLKKCSVFRALFEVTVPLNLGDSIVVIACKK